jgi:hypothetical protein
MPPDEGKRSRTRPGVAVPPERSSVVTWRLVREGSPPLCLFGRGLARRYVLLRFTRAREYQVRQQPTAKHSAGD